MKYIYFIALLILASAYLGSAQLPNGSNLSDGCTSALTKIFGDKDVNACFPFSAVIPLATSKNSIPDSNTLKTAADSICAAPKCSDSLISKTQADFKAACQQDLNNKNPTATLIGSLIPLYSPTRDSVCFKNSTGGYCFIESLTTAEKIYQSNPNQDPVLTFAGAPKEVVCTPCNKAIVNTYFNFQKTNPDAFTGIPNASNKNIDTAKNALEGKCGANFLDGQIGNSEESPTKFQDDNKINSKSSDAISLIANRWSFVALLGTILATL